MQPIRDQAGSQGKVAMFVRCYCGYHSAGLNYPQQLRRNPFHIFDMLEHPTGDDEIEGFVRVR